MNVLHPGLAIGALAAIAVPILIHLLLRRRRRVIQWAAMALLERAMRRDRRRQRIERWLLLAARCLLVALAGLALAQPFIGPGRSAVAPNRTVWIIVDDGVSSAERLPDGGTAIERSIAEARRLVASLGAGDSVALISASAPVRRLVDPPTADKDRVDALLAAMQPASTGSSIPQAILEAVEGARAAEDAAEIALFSGFRRGSLDPSSAAPEIDPSSTRSMRLSALPPLTGSSSNAWIAEVEPLRSGDEGVTAGDRAVRVRMERRGGELPRQVRRVTASGSAQGAADATIDAGERRGGIELRLRREPMDGAAGDALTVSIDDDAQPRDDRLFTVLPPDRPARVVVLDRRGLAARHDLEHLSSGVWMARALAPSRGVSLQVDEVDPGSLDRSILQGADAVVLARPDLVSPEGWTLLRNHADTGGAIVVTPAPEDSGQRWIDRFRTAFAPSWQIESEVEASDSAWRLAAQQPPSATLRMLGSEISLLAAPVTANRRMRISAPPADAESALLFEDSAPLLLAGRPAGATRGWVMLLGAAPELAWTDLPVRPLMVPLMQELVRQGRSLASADSRARVGDRTELPRGAVSLVRRRESSADGSPAASAQLPGAVDGRTRDPLLQPGIYDALDERGRQVGAIAVNIDPVRASIEPNEATAVRAWLEKSGAWTWMGDPVEPRPIGVESTVDSGTWSMALLLLAIGVALGETVLARVLSRGDAMRGAA